MSLDAAAAGHSARVREHLTAQIDAAGGWLSFERFMDLALYAPGLGYYSGGAQKLGRGGDFTTAPEVSSLFGACVAVQCADVLRELTAGSILEIGAGSGRLAADVLERLESLGRLPQQYLILEVSADLRERQCQYLARRLPHLAPRVRWIDSPPQSSFDGVIIANEVLDALPVARFRRQSGSIDELGVAINDGTFVWAPRTAGAAMAEMCRRLCGAGGGWDEGYVSEYCPRVAAWTHAVTQSLRQGAALWFDYGLPRAQYYLPERHDGTLICHYRHQAHFDPFEHVGLQDISAWVDFTLLAEASHAAGFELAGFTTQAYFLAGTGIDREMHHRAGCDENAFARLAGEARQLMMPGEMGERFKAMAWLRALDIPLSGFALQDLRHTL
jgi:SAM-dependent MidA family methyltransferase